MLRALSHRGRIIPVAIVFCLLPLSAAGAPSPTLAQEIQALLDRRAKAFSERDRAAFLATADPSQVAFAKRQATLFDNSIPVEGFTLHADFDRLPLLTRSRDRERLGESTVVIGVQERYSLGSFDASPALLQRFYAFTRRDGGWVIADDDPLADLGFPSERDLWEFGPVVTRSSAHFLAVYHPDLGSRIDELLAVAESSIPDVGRAWSKQWTMKVPILIPSSIEEVSKMLNATFDVGNFVAFAIFSVDLDGADPWRYVGPRILLNVTNLFRHTQRSQRAILAHELVHVATREYSGPFVPAFVEEGLAQLAEGSGDVINLPGNFDGVPPEDWRFSAGTSREINRAYAESLSAVALMKRDYGIERVQEFYSTLGKERIAPGTADYQLNRALSSSFGVSLDRFEQDWSKAA